MNIDYEIRKELDKLLDLKSPRTLRERTILALARAMADGEALPLGSDGVVSERTYYNSKKDWHGNPLFVEVLERLADLYREQDLAIRNAEDTAARQKRHEERAALIRKGKKILVGVVEKLETVDWQTTPVSLDEARRFMKDVFAEERIEFDELPTSSSRVDVTSDGESVAVPVIYLPDNERD
jgi:hypothetical protein